jgi:hypothetical protein
VPIKIFFICTHILFKTNISLIQTTRPHPLEDQQHPTGGGGTVWELLLQCFLVELAAKACTNHMHSNINRRIGARGRGRTQDKTEKWCHCETLVFQCMQMFQRKNRRKLFNNAVRLPTCFWTEWAPAAYQQATFALTGHSQGADLEHSVAYNLFGVSDTVGRGFLETTWVSSCTPLSLSASNSAQTTCWFWTYVLQYPSNGSTAQIGPWPPLNHTEVDTR